MDDDAGKVEWVASFLDPRLTDPECQSVASIAHRLSCPIVNLAEGMETARMFAYIAFAVAIAATLNTITSSLERRAKRQ